MNLAAAVASVNLVPDSESHWTMPRIDPTERSYKIQSLIPDGRSEYSNGFSIRHRFSLFCVEIQFLDEMVIRTLQNASYPKVSYPSYEQEHKQGNLDCIYPTSPSLADKSSNPSMLTESEQTHFILF